MNVEFVKTNNKVLKDETVESINDEEETHFYKWILKTIVVDEVIVDAQKTKKIDYEEEEIKYLKAAKEAAKAST